MKSPAKQTSLSERLEIYKKALLFISDLNNESLINYDYESGLCLILPHIWLASTPEQYCKGFHDKNGQLFTYYETPKYFPEFGKYYPDTIFLYKDIYRVDKMAWRIKVLNEIIKSMEQ